MKKYFVIFLFTFFGPIFAMYTHTDGVALYLNFDRKILQFPAEDIICGQLKKIFTWSIESFIAESQLVSLFAGKQMSFTAVSQLIEVEGNRFNQKKPQFLLSYLDKFHVCDALVRMAKVISGEL